MKELSFKNTNVFSNVFIEENLWAKFNLQELSSFNKYIISSTIEEKS